MYIYIYSFDLCPTIILFLCFVSDQSAIFLGALDVLCAVLCVAPAIICRYLLLLFSAFDSKNCCTFLLRLGWCYAASSFPVTCSYWLFLLLFFDFDRFLINDVTTEALLFTVSTKKAKSLPTKSIIISRTTAVPGTTKWPLQLNENHHTLRILLNEIPRLIHRHEKCMNSCYAKLDNCNT